MKNIFLLILFTSCSSTIFKKKQPNKSELDQSAIKSDYKTQVTSWSDSYYTQTTLKVQNPLLKEDSKKIFNICQGKDISFARGYSASRLSRIKFKKTPVTIYTNDGFKMKAYITKGICRELALLKSQLKDNEKSFRKSIKSIDLQYIYNGDVYATSMVLNTQFKSVKFHVE